MPLHGLCGIARIHAGLHVIDVDKLVHEVNSHGCAGYMRVPKLHGGFVHGCWIKGASKDALICMIARLKVLARMHWFA
jgi:hypothetical protein